MNVENSPVDLVGLIFMINAELVDLALEVEEAALGFVGLLLDSDFDVGSDRIRDTIPFGLEGVPVCFLDVCLKYKACITVNLFTVEVLLKLEDLLGSREVLLVYEVLRNSLETFDCCSDDEVAHQCVNA